MNIIVKIASVATIAVMAVVLEASHPGFYTSKFNLDREALIIKNELIGQPAELAVELLGKPNNVIEKESGEVVVEYYPYSFMPYSRFQLRIVEGKLEKVRKFIF